MKMTFGGVFSADDVATKNTPIARNWSVLQAGNDVTDAPPILEQARQTLKPFPAPSGAEAAGALHQAYSERLRQQTEARLLHRYGYTLERFLKEGKSQLTEHVFNQIWEQISKIEISMEFLLLGFDGIGEPHLFFVDGRNAPASYDDVGFCVIGSGGETALATLVFHVDRSNLGAYLSWTNAVYCVCDAKFRAESASDVGQQTFLAIYEHEKEVQLISPIRVEREIRATWERYGAHRTPASIRNLLPTMTYHASQIGTEEGWRRFVGNRPMKSGQRNLMREYQALQRAIRHNDKIKERQAER